MRQLAVHKASPLGEPGEIETTHILIELPIPDCDTLAETFAIYEHDAKLIAEALFGALPQATLYRLLADLMGRYAEKDGYKGVMKGGVL